MLKNVIFLYAKIMHIKCLNNNIQHPANNDDY